MTGLTPSSQAAREWLNSVRRDKSFLSVAELYRGRPDFDWTTLVVELVEAESVPGNIDTAILREWPTEACLVGTGVGSAALGGSHEAAVRAIKRFQLPRRPTLQRSELRRKLAISLRRRNTIQGLSEAVLLVPAWKARRSQGAIHQLPVLRTRRRSHPGDRMGWVGSPSSRHRPLPPTTSG